MSAILRIIERAVLHQRAFRKSGIGIDDFGLGSFG
jgi:hypothetical protein